MENLRDYMKHLMQYFVISTAFILMQYLELPREVQYSTYLETINSWKLVFGTV